MDALSSTPLSEIVVTIQPLEPSTEVAASASVAPAGSSDLPAETHTAATAARAGARTSRNTSAHQAPRPTHFLSIRLPSLELAQKIHAIQTRLVHEAQVPVSFLQPLVTLHITLFVFAVRKNELERAIECLRAAEDAIDAAFVRLSEALPHLRFSNVGQFSGGRVLWIGPDADDHLTALRQLVGVLAERFRAAGIEVDPKFDHNEWVPHLTVMKRKQEKRSPRQRKGKRWQHKGRRGGASTAAAAASHKQQGESDDEEAHGDDGEGDMQLDITAVTTESITTAATAPAEITPPTATAQQPLHATTTTTTSTTVSSVSVFTTTAASPTTATTTTKPPGWKEWLTWPECTSVSVVCPLRYIELSAMGAPAGEFYRCYGRLFLRAADNEQDRTVRFVTLGPETPVPAIEAAPVLPVITAPAPVAAAVAAPTPATTTTTTTTTTTSHLETTTTTPVTADAAVLMERTVVDDTVAVTIEESASTHRRRRARPMELRDRHSDDDEYDDYAAGTRRKFAGAPATTTATTTTTAAATAPRVPGYTAAVYAVAVPKGASSAAAAAAATAAAIARDSTPPTPQPGSAVAVAELPPLPVGARMRSKLRTSEEVLKRLQFDTSLCIDEWTVGYEDRFCGIIALPVPRFLREREAEGIPLHRIKWFMRADTLMWCRTRKFDALFSYDDDDDDDDA